MHGPSLDLSRPYPAKTQEGQVETNVVHVHPDSLSVRVEGSINSTGAGDVFIAGGVGELL